MITRPMVAEDSASGFTCGEHALDDYFRRHAFKNHVRGLGRTFVLPGKAGVRGFYTLAMAAIEPASVAAQVPALPRYPVPAALIGRFAVHKDAQGQGLGQALLRDALERVLGVAAEVGCVVVLVDAKNAAAQKFYARLGFIAIGGDKYPVRMFLPTETLAASVNKS